MLKFIRAFASDRKVRAFVVACCRRLWHLFEGTPFQPWVETAERFTDRRAGPAELADAEVAARRVAEWGSGEQVVGPLWCAGWYSDLYGGARANAGMADSPATLALAATMSDAWAGAELCLPWAAALGVDTPEQAAILRDIVHAPHRAVYFQDAWRLWSDRTVYRLARAIDEGRGWHHLALLHDALLDAGCDAEDVLEHCRSSGPHVRGCWVLDLILLKG
jgi:hypothetical protein